MTDPAYIRLLEKLHTHVSPHQAILLSCPTDITYFSDFIFLVPEEREAVLFISQKHVCLIKTHFSLLPEKTQYEVKNGCRPSQLGQHLHQLCQEHKITELAVDASSLFLEEFRAIEAALPDVHLTDFEKHSIWQMRMVKDTHEQGLLRQAGQIIAEVMAEMPKLFRTGCTEKELATRLEQLLQEHGASGPAFPTIVAFGPHAARPHHQPTTAKLTPNTAVLIDAGARYENYRSDMTRTWWFGDSPTPLFQQVEAAVKEAHQSALALFKSSSHRIAADLDKAARNVLTQAGFGQQFIHTTGHGIGIDIHEPPSLTARVETPLKPGMVVTIEPGVYIDNEFGYRHEDTVLVKNRGLEVLTVKKTKN